MKKILLGTTTLFGAAVLFAGAANAEGPKVTLGGFSDFQVGVVSEDLDTNLRSGAFRTETDLVFKIDGKTDSGLGYGGNIELTTSNTADQDNNTSQVGKSWVYVDGAWGRVQGGSDYGVTKTMKIDASSIARATGGIDGDYHYFMTNTTGQVIGTPDLLLDYGNISQLGDERQEAINKVSYYTPRFAGFQAGISYLFDTTATDRGITTSRGDNNAGEAENVFLGALSWEGKFDAVSLGAAATGEFGNAEAAGVEDLQTWNVGAKAGYMGFTVAGSYGDWGDSLRAASNLDESNYWTLGAAYETGPVGASVTYLDSTYAATSTTENEFTNISVGVDYKLAPGFTPYAEVSFVEIDVAAGTANDNDATVFIAGTQLAF